MLAASVMFVVLYHTMHSQIHTQRQEQDGAYMPEPFLEGLQPVGEIADADSAVADQPRNEHNRQTRAETEDDGHQPVPTARQRQRDVDHRQEIDEPVRTKSNRKENTEDERPQPTLLAVGLFEPFADAVVVLVVMMSAEKQHNAANEHKRRQNRLAPMT